MRVNIKNNNNTNIYNNTNNNYNSLTSEMLWVTYYYKYKQQRPDNKTAIMPLHASYVRTVAYPCRSVTCLLSLLVHAAASQQPCRLDMTYMTHLSMPAAQPPAIILILLIILLTTAMPVTGGPAAYKNQCT
jgi:hypothetical protein